MPNEPVGQRMVAYYPLWYGDDRDARDFVNAILRVLAVRQDVSIVDIDVATRTRFKFSFVEGVYTSEEIVCASSACREHLAKLLKGNCVILKTEDGLVTDVLIELPSPSPA